MAVKLGNGKWAVKENNLLAYNDNSGQFFNKEFDFTRGSSATYVGKDGLIKTAGLQDTNLVQNGDFSELGSELIVNGDFETDSSWIKGTGWSIENGIATIDGTQTSASNLFSNSMSVTSGKTYKIVVNVLSASSGLRLYANGSVIEFNLSVGENVFYETVSSSTYQLALLGLSGTTGSIDNVSVKQVDPNDEWTLGSGWSYGDGKAISTNSTNSNLENVSISIANGKQYKFTFEITDFTGNGFVRPQLGAVGAVLGTYVQGNGVYSQILIANNNFDRIVLRTGGGDGFNGSVSNISVQEIQVNTPRIDFSDSADGALLLEPQSTNTVTYSEDFINVSWGKANSPTLISGELAPNGTLSATKISGTIGSSYIALASASSTTATRSIYAKTVSGTGTAKLMSYHGNTNNLFTLTEEWQRFELTGSSTIGGTSFYVDFRDNSQTLNEFIIWGAQSEELTYPTSYIPTNGSASTRIAETCNNSGSAQDFNDSEGVLFADISALVNDNNFKAISVSESNVNNRITLSLYQGSLFAYIADGGVSQFNVSQSVGSVLEFHKTAIKYKANDCAFWIDGFEVAINTSPTTMPSGLKELAFDKGNGGDDFYGKTKEIGYYDTALTDEELEYITSYRSLNELVTALKLNTL